LANDDRDQAARPGNSHGAADAGSANPAADYARPSVQDDRPLPGEREPTDDVPSAIPGQQLYGLQPPLNSRSSLSRQAPQQPLSSRDPGPGAEEAGLARQGSWRAFGEAAESRPAAESGPGGSPGLADPPGRAEGPGSIGLPGGTVDGRPGCQADPDPYGPRHAARADPFASARNYGPGHRSPPADAYGLADVHDPADPYGPADDVYGPADAYGPADTYGPPGGYAPADLRGVDPQGPADLHGPADVYGPPEAYSPADPYGPANAYGPADPYGPLDVYAPAHPPRMRRPTATPAAAGSHGPADPLGTASGYWPTESYGPADDGTGHADSHDQASSSGEPGSSGPDDGPGPADPSSGATSGQPAQPRQASEETESLTPGFLLPARRRAPAPGWRRVIYQATGGLMRVPSSAAELRRRDMISRVRTPVASGHHRVAVLSLKGGVGKTTTTVGLGSTLASLRGDRVIAVDANPDRGTLSDKVGLETSATVRDLLNERARVRRYADVRAFTSQAVSRLEVLASDRDPMISVAFSDDDYCEVAGVLEHFYSICITDCGTGLLHSAMTGVLRLADQIVLISSPSVDGARSPSATLDWLAAHSYGDLVRNAVVVLSAVRPRSRSTLDLNRLEEHFAGRCRAVTKIPYDAHLEEGAEVELEQLSRPTADAYLALAAIVGDGLAWSREVASGRAC
jgi:MinD-like ATPase involved in chromosome partitioning or flagellar assembly